MIRKAKLKDCRACYGLCNTKGTLDPGGKPPKKWWIESFAKENQLFFVAEENKEIVGFIIGERISGNIALLQLIIVRKKYQNKGIGTMLIKKFKKECRKRKLKVIIVYSYTKNKSLSHMLTKDKWDKGSSYYEFQKWLN